LIEVRFAVAFARDAHTSSRCPPTFAARRRSQVCRRCATRWTAYAAIYAARIAAVSARARRCGAFTARRDKRRLQPVRRRAPSAATRQQAARRAPRRRFRFRKRPSAR
jgi:hypothetical protein